MLLPCGRTFGIATTSCLASDSELWRFRSVYGSVYDLRLKPVDQIVTRWKRTVEVTARYGEPRRTRNNDVYAFAASVGVRSDAHNGLNQIVTGGSGASHDTRGNMTGDASRAYGYSSENLMTSVSGGWSLGYDAASRLLEVTDGTSTTRFAYDGLNMAAEFDGGGTLLRRHVYAPGIEEPLLTYEGSGIGDRRVLDAAARASIITQSNFWRAGDVISVNRFDEYGVPRYRNVPGIVLAGESGQ